MLGRGRLAPVLPFGLFTAQIRPAGSDGRRRTEFVSLGECGGAVVVGSPVSEVDPVMPEYLARPGASRTIDSGKEPVGAEMEAGRPGASAAAGAGALRPLCPRSGAERGREAGVQAGPSRAGPGRLDCGMPEALCGAVGCPERCAGAEPAERWYLWAAGFRGACSGSFPLVLLTGAAGRSLGAELHLGVWALLKWLLGRRCICDAGHGVCRAA